jgi:hypothetical protein
MSRRKQLRKNFFTLMEVSAYADLSDRTIKRLARKGLLKKYRQPGVRVILYSRQELDALLAPRPVSA